MGDTHIRPLTRTHITIITHPLWRGPPRLGSTEPVSFPGAPPTQAWPPDSPSYPPSEPRLSGASRLCFWQVPDSTLQELRVRNGAWEAGHDQGKTQKPVLVASRQGGREHRGRERSFSSYTICTLGTFIPWHLYLCKKSIFLPRGVWVQARVGEGEAISWILQLRLGSPVS